VRQGPRGTDASGFLGYPDQARQGGERKGVVPRRNSDTHPERLAHARWFAAGGISVAAARCASGSRPCRAPCPRNRQRAWPGPNTSLSGSIMLDWACASSGPDTEGRGLFRAAARSDLLPGDAKGILRYDRGRDGNCAPGHFERAMATLNDAQAISEKARRGPFWLAGNVVRQGRRSESAVRQRIGARPKNATVEPVVICAGTAGKIARACATRLARLRHGQGPATPNRANLLAAGLWLVHRRLRYFPTLKEAKALLHGA